MTRRQWVRARKQYNANRRAVNCFLKRYHCSTRVPPWYPEGIRETLRIARAGGSLWFYREIANAVDPSLAAGAK